MGEAILGDTQKKYIFSLLAYVQFLPTQYSY